MGLKNQLVTMSFHIQVPAAKMATRGVVRWERMAGVTVDPCSELGLGSSAANRKLLH